MSFFFASGTGFPVGTLAVLVIGFATAWAFGLLRHGDGFALTALGTIVAPIAAVVLMVAGFLTIFYATNVTEPPALLDGLKYDQSWDGPTKALRASLREHFPPGAREANLVSTLGDQGFVVDGTHKTARYDWNSMVCNNTVRVDWTAPGGRIATIDGEFSATCL